MKFIKNEFLTNTVNFGRRFTFSAGPGPGPLYKLCQVNL